METHKGRVKSFGPHHLKNFQSVNTQLPKHTLPSVREAVGEALPPSVRALCSQKSFGRSKQALPSKKSSPLARAVDGSIIYMPYFVSLSQM